MRGGGGTEVMEEVEGGTGVAQRDLQLALEAPTGAHTFKRYR